MRYVADVIIVLGAGVLPSGMPSPTLERRTLFGIELFRKEAAPRMLFSGGIGSNGYSESRVMSRLALERQVPDDRIVVDEHSTNTMESAINCSRIMKEQGWIRAIIVTDSYHLFRSVLSFRQMGMYAMGKSPPSGRGKTAMWRWILYHVREIVAIPWYLIQFAQMKRRMSSD